jgi:hypothetical protein
MGQVYTWKNIIVKVYSLPMIIPTDLVQRLGNENAACLLPSTDPELEMQHLVATTPIYESGVLPTPPSLNNSWQYFELPFGVVGNVITFTLLGKNFRHFEDSRFYVCVQRVATRGIPLYHHVSDIPPMSAADERDLHITPLVYR